MRRDALHFVTHGEPEHPAILFLHGFMGSASDWAEVVSRLEGAWYCICVDLPGHGESVALAGDYTVEWTAQLLADVLNRTEIRRADVVGYSMGGRAALYFAMMHPEKCRRLVLESSSPGLPTEDERAARREIDEARAVRIESGEYLAFIEEWYRQPLFETYQRQEGLLERMIRSRQSNSPGELARSLRGMGTGCQPSLWDRLDEMRMPVLAVAGALDGKYVEAAERMAVRMPRARAAVMPDAGHNLHVEKPDAYARILIDFFKKPT